MASETVPRNVLNVEDVDRYVKRLTTGDDVPKHIRAWWTSTFRRWLLQEYEGVKPVVLASEARNPLVIIAGAVLKGLGIAARLDTLLTENVHFLDDKTAPEWALSALAARQNLVYVVAPDEQQTQVYHHWIDFCRTLPERDIRHTVPHMERAVAAYDRQLSRQKLLQELTEGVTVVETPAFDALTPVAILVRLDTQGAYKAEGAVMHHCVGSYWGRKSTEIYSLRQLDVKTPVATIEVLRGSIEQVKGPANQKVSTEVEQAVRAWAAAAGFSWREARAYDEDDEEYEEEEDEENEEDDEEGAEDWEEDDEEDANADRREQGPARVTPVERIIADITNTANRQLRLTQWYSGAIITHEGRARPLAEFMPPAPARALERQQFPTVGVLWTFLQRAVPSFERSSIIAYSTLFEKLQSIPGIGENLGTQIADALIAQNYLEVRPGQVHLEDHAALEPTAYIALGAEDEAPLHRLLSQTMAARLAAGGITTARQLLRFVDESRLGPGRRRRRRYAMVSLFLRVLQGTLLNFTERDCQALLIRLVDGQALRELKDDDMEDDDV